MQLVEISDEPWCPAAIRHGVTDYSRFVTELTGAYTPVAPLLAAALRQTHAASILDLGSGGAGPWLGLQPVLKAQGVDVPICLSDHFPDLEALERAHRRAPQAITHHRESVDATHVPEGLPGFRTMFSAFHHLRPEQARAVLTDAMARREGIGVFEAMDRGVLTLLYGALPTPIRMLLMAPFIQPFRWSRLFWTYVVPALPLILMFDTVVSCLRFYSVPELRELTAGLDTYHWEIGTTRGKIVPVGVTYLIGVPLDEARVRA